MVTAWGLGVVRPGTETNADGEKKRAGMAGKCYGVPDARCGLDQADSAGKVRIRAIQNFPEDRNFLASFY